MLAILQAVFGWFGAGLVKVLGAEVLQPILKSMDAKTAAQRDITVAEIGSDERQSVASIQGLVEANKLRAAAQPQFTLLIYLIALPPALHSAGVYLDSLPFWTPWGAHVVGAWGVPKPPPPFDGYQKEILLSFFIVAPAVQGIKALGSIASAAVTRR